jgi:hypothetical protein
VGPFLLPWLSSRTIPDVTVSIAGSRVTLSQRQPGERFDLPVEVRLETALGPVLRLVHLKPAAKHVMLLGLSQPPLPAADTAGVWVVEVPLTEGRYFWAWSVDGKAEMPGQTTDSTRYGVRVVRSLRSIDVP